MATVNVKREFFAIRYAHAEFGARPDLDDATMDLVSHSLAEGRCIVVECDTMSDAYMAAHAVIGKKIEQGPLRGRSTAGDVEVLRVVEHDPAKPTPPSDDVYTHNYDLLWPTPSITMTITGVDLVRGVPHWASAPLSRYSPVNGWETPKTIDV